MYYEGVVCVCVCVCVCVAVYDSRLGCTIPGQALLKIPERAGMGGTAQPSSCSLALTRKVGVVVVID